MTFATRCEFAAGRIDPAPMVDVVFLLLIFLVLSSPFVLQPGFGIVDLPKSPVPQNVSFQGLVVTVSRNDMLFFNTQRISLSDLPAALRKAASESRNPELIIKADSQVPNGTVVKIMNMAFEAGISAVNLATRPELPGTAPSR
jgi:biopolymer transport protein ExbD